MQETKAFQSTSEMRVDRKCYAQLALLVLEMGVRLVQPQQLVLIRPVERGLVMHGLYYADEVRGFDEIEFGDEVTLKAGEVELANQLIEQLSSERFDPGRYEDEYRRAVLELVDRKVAGEETITMPKSEPREQIIDLVAALKKSLAAKEEGAKREVQRVRKPARAKGKSPRRGRKAASE